MRKEVFIFVFILLIGVLLYAPGYAQVEENRFVVDEKIWDSRLGPCEDVGGFEEVGRIKGFESVGGNVELEYLHCVAYEEEFRNGGSYVVNSYLTSEKTCKNSEIAGGFIGKNGKATLCVSIEVRGEGEDFGLVSDVSTKEKCLIGYEEGESFEVFEGSVRHCRKGGGVVEEEVVGKETRTAKGTLAITNCNLLQTKESCEAAGCISVFEAGSDEEEAPAPGIRCLGPSGSVANNDEMEFSDCRRPEGEEIQCGEDCLGIKNIGRCAGTDFCRVINGECYSSGCDGFYSFGSTANVEICDGDSQVVIDIEEGRPVGEGLRIESGSSDGFCIEFEVTIDGEFCDASEEVVEIPVTPPVTPPITPPEVTPPEQVFVSPPEQAKAKFAIGPCGDVYESDEECEMANGGSTNRKNGEICVGSQVDGEDEEDSGENEGKLSEECIEIIGKINSDNEFEDDLYEGKKFRWRVWGEKFIVVGYAKAVVEFESTFYIDEKGEKSVKVVIDPVDSRIAGLDTVAETSGESYAKKLWPDDGKSICVDKQPYKEKSWTGRISFNRKKFMKEMSKNFLKSFNNNGGKITLLITNKKVIVVDGNGNGRDVNFNIVCGDKIFDTSAKATEEDGKKIVIVDYDGEEKVIELDSSLNPGSGDLSDEFDETVEKVRNFIEELKVCLDNAKKHCEKKGGNSDEIDCYKINPP